VKIGSGRVSVCDGEDGSREGSVGGKSSEANL
jgi:hypothetical protein